MSSTKIYPPFRWINRHAGLVIGLAMVAVLTLGAVGPMFADTSEPNFDPSGEVFDTASRAEATLASDSTLRQATYLVEASDGGDVLTASALNEWLMATERVAASDRWQVHLSERYDRDLAATVPSVMSLATAVDGALPNGLATATDAEVKLALAQLLDPAAPTASLVYTLSEESSSTPGSAGGLLWRSPAFLTQVSYDSATFDTYEDSEVWLREVQAEFRSGEVHTESIGVAIDGDLTFGETAAESSPFIFLAVALIVVLIGVVHRSYWSAIVVASGLGATMLAYYGISSLVGLKMGSMLLAFIVPIAMISFGVDFYIHGTGRVREMQIDGVDRSLAYPTGITAVFGALLLAAASSVGAFLSNVFTGTEAIVEFGVGAAIAIAMAYFILGLLAPRALLALEGFVGLNPVKGAVRHLYRIAFVPMAVVAGLAVALAAVMPQLGAAAVSIVAVVLVLVPALISRRRNKTAATRGLVLDDEIRGVGHGLVGAGSLVHFLARFRVVTVPIVLIIGVLGLFAASKVESGFEINDFLSAETSFVQSIDKIKAHFPSSGEGSSFIFVEGDLTDPDALASLDGAVAAIDASSTAVGRQTDGNLIVAPHAGDLVRMTMASSEATDSLAVAVTDTDGDGLPDTREQVRALYDYISVRGVPAAAGGGTAIAAEDVLAYLADDGAVSQATAIVVQVGSFTDGDIISGVRNTLEEAAAAMELDVPQITTSVSGEVITQFESLESFTNSMLISLPIAVLLTFLIAMLMLRSVRYALASVIPIAFVVIGVYAFMAVAGYTVNVVTATIAAIAVGVGIDFSTHFTARYREELGVHSTKLDAVRRAGEGTGGALVLSAVTSVLGFLVMALAPTPIFATFGALTAAMVALSLLVALVVLPSILVMVSPTQVRAVGSKPLVVDPEPARATA